LLRRLPGFTFRRICFFAKQFDKITKTRWIFNLLSIDYFDKLVSRGYHHFTSGTE
jgi:hypothetical protein